MAYEIQFTKSARKALDALASGVRNRVDALIARLVAEPRMYGAIKLEGGTDAYRARAGDHRVIYEINDAAQRVLIVAIGDRKEIYRR